MELQKATGFLKNAYYQGHGRYVNQIARLTLRFCKQGGASRELRKFIETRLVDTARLNPGCVMYVKPRLFKGPSMRVEYLNGEVHQLTFARMSADQIEAWIGWYLTRSGNHLDRLQRNTTTYRASVQGIWNPFLFRNPELNVTKFPSDQLGAHIAAQPSATEALRKIAAQDPSFNSQQSSSDDTTTRAQVSNNH